MFKLKVIKQYLPVLALIVLFLVPLACAESTPTSEAKISTATSEAIEQEQPSETEQSQSEPSDTQEVKTTLTNTPESQPLYLGDTVEQFGYTLTALNVEDPATPGMFYEPITGKKLVAVEVIVGVSSGDPTSVNPLYATLLDSEGFSYQPELGGRDGQIATTELFPGEKVRGWISFSIPDNAVPASIKYSTEVFGGQAMKTELENPPEGHEAANINTLSMMPPEPQAKLGDVVEQYNYSLTALTVEDPASPGMFFEPKSEYKLVAVEIVVGNVSGDPLSVNPLYALLVDDRGFVYQSELGGRDDQLATMDINSGEKVRGWVSFQIPEDRAPSIIKYQIGVFSYTYLVSGLTE